MVTEEGVTFQVPEGNWKIYVTQLTRNRGPHRDYINMMDKASCQVQIEAVYEPHWAHYKEEFGKTIAGVFLRMSRSSETDIFTITTTDWDVLRPWTIRGAGNWKYV